MTTLDNKIIQMAEYAAGKLGLPARFLASWWVSENGWTWPSNNNVGNVSYTGEGIPTGGVFQGVTHVEENRVCDYGTDEQGVDAFCLLLETPKADKVLTIDLAELKALGGDVHAMTQAVGNSNWAESHYITGGEGPGSLIWDVYNSAGMAAAFPTVEVSQPTSKPVDTVEVSQLTSKPVDTVEDYRHVHYVQEGETLSQVALRYQVPVRALAVINGLDNPNVVQIGRRLGIPSSYKVKPGDTVSQIAAKYGDTVERVAAANGINPNFIYSGQTLFV